MLYHNNSKEEQPILTERMSSKIKTHNNKEEEILINSKIIFHSKDQINSNSYFQIQI